MNRKFKDYTSLVSSALKRGILKKTPCVMCGSGKNVQGHHADYDKPLEVVWVCREHHTMIHVELNRKGKKKEPEQVQHIRLSDRVHRELRVRAVKKGVKVGKIIDELVFPKKA